MKVTMVRGLTDAEYQEMKEAAKSLGFKVSLSFHKQQYAYGAIDISPVKANDYTFTPEQIDTLWGWLASMGFQMDSRYYENRQYIYASGFNYFRKIVTPDPSITPEAAKELGRKAFADGKVRIPMTDPEMVKLLEGMQVGNSIDYLKSWIDGWDIANVASIVEDVPAEEPAPVPAPAKIGYKYDYSPAREKNERNYKGTPGIHEPCFICGKAVDTTNPHYMIHIVDGGGIAATEEEAKHFDPNGDMGSFPVGSECIRKQPGLKSRATLVNPLSPSPEGDDPVIVQQPQPEPQEAPAPKNRELVIPDPNNAGLLVSRKNRKTGYYTSLYKSAEAGIESDPDLPYATVCEQHGLLVCHSSRALAMGNLSQPFEWCSYCQSIVYDKVDIFDQGLGG